MKINRFLFWCGMAALPHAAMADVGSTNPAGLGDIQALLNFCAQVDPAGAATFQAEWANIVSGSAQTQLTSVEGGGAYKQGYDDTLAALKKLPKHEAASQCGSIVSAWNNPGGHPGDDSDKDHRHATNGHEERPHH